MGQVWRVLLAVPVAGIGAALLIPHGASSVPAPPEIQEASPITVDYFDSVTIHGFRNDPDNTIVVEDMNGDPVDCGGPIPDNGLRFFECTPQDLYDSADLGGTTTELSFFEVDDALERSLPAVVTIAFAESRFQVTTPPRLPSGDTITLRGELEEAATSVQWTLERGSTSVLGQPQECVIEVEGGEFSTAFECTYDDGPGNRTGPASVRPASLALPAILPGGEYTATIDEYKAGIVPPIATLVFVFDVAGPPPAAVPAPPPGIPGPPTLVDEGPITPIPLAPLRDGPVLLGPPGDELAPPADQPPNEDDPQAAPSVAQTPGDVLRILILAITAFTILAMIGPRGVAAPRRLAWASASTGGAGTHSASRSGAVAAVAAIGGGEVEGAEDDAGRTGELGDAWGDRSPTWRSPGWPRLDALSIAAPAALATRLPLVSRVVADAAYLRASLGMLWLALPLVGATLGVVAALGGDSAALPPSLALTAALLVLAVLDATTGVVAVLAFAAVTVARGGLTADGLDLGEGVRGLLGLGALWFVTPLVAAAARPLRRSSESGRVYGWDRLGDVVIAALLGGWAVQGIVGGLGDLTGRDLPITAHADSLALLAIAAVVGRFGIEELTAVGYPRRLSAVEPAETGEPATIHHLRGLAVRAALLAFFAGAFLGNCWQLWAGVAVFAVPQLMALVGDRIPDLAHVAAAVPRGVTQILVLVMIGTAIAYLLDAGVGTSETELETIRTGFVLLAIPAAALEVLSVLGGDEPAPQWTWPRQLAGAAVVAITTAIVTLLL